MTEPASPAPVDTEGRRPIGRARARTFARPRRASRAIRGTAPKPDVSTRMFHRPEPTGPIFVDRSGRRARRLRHIAYWLVVVALVVLALWWLSQVLLVGSESR
jgi:hypothetical protein